MKDFAVVVLAAGLGTRMRSGKAKVLHPVAGRPMLLYVLDSVRALKPQAAVVVTGHQAADVGRLLPEGFVSALQKQQKGTGHAVLAGLGRLKGFSGTVMVVSGDAPLLGADTLRRLLAAHRRTKADMSVLTAELVRPKGYGRIVRGKSGIQRIVEEADATAAEKRITEVNAGTYCFEMRALKAALRSVRADNAQAEFYLTDTVEITASRGGRVTGVAAGNAEEALGVNSRAELAEAGRIIRARTMDALMKYGVSIIDPAATYIDAGVAVGRDTVIHPGNHIFGNSIIGEGCTLLPGNVITNSTLKSGAKVMGHCVITESCIDEGASVGPFAHLRPGSRVSEGARAGNFVELKKTILGKGAKASHLSYLGDAVIGRDVNIGAGTITCNYDGYDKFRTVIEDGVFVGSDTQIIAPVTVGKGAVIAAGTTLTSDVPPDALAMSRTPQVNRTGWAKKRRNKKAKRKEKG